MAIFSETIPIGNSSFIRKIQMDFPSSGGPPDPKGAAGDIHVSMSGARTYVYAVPSGMIWVNFKKAGSKGKYYDAVIKRRFDYFRKY